MATAEELRRVSGGVIGHFTPKELVIDANKLAVGETVLGLKVPAKKFVYGAYIKNDNDDLASGGAATIKVTVGSTDVISATGLSDLKGKGVAALDTSPDYTAAERDVKVTVGTAAYTAGKLIVGVIYG
jgi:hypothetical protein